MRKPISQREARKLRKRVEELEQHERNRNNRWVSDWPSSKGMHRLSVDVETAAIVNTARLLGHAVIATMDDDRVLKLWGYKLS